MSDRKKLLIAFIITFAIGSYPIIHNVDEIKSTSYGPLFLLPILFVLLYAAALVYHAKN